MGRRWGVFEGVGDWEEGSTDVIRGVGVGEGVREVLIGGGEGGLLVSLRNIAEFFVVANQKTI